jgi:hypothetical protein
MKLILTHFTALLLAPLAALHGVEQVLMREVSITNSRSFFVYLTNWL